MVFNFLIELKNRMILVIGMWICLMVASYSNKEILLFIFSKPWLTLSFINNSLYFISTNLTEIFITYLKISYFVSNQITFMYILYHSIIFVIPGLYCKEYRLILNKCISLIFFFVFFLTFFNKIIVPFVCSFFLTLQKILTGQMFTLHFEAKINEYIDFYILLYKLCFFIIISFNIILNFNKYLMFSNFTGSIKNYRKYYYLIFIIVSTIVSPPEINFQLLISFLSISIYELFLILIFFKKNLQF